MLTKLGFWKISRHIIAGCSKKQQIRYINYRMQAKCAEELRNTSLVSVEEVRRFIQDCLTRVGVPKTKLRCIADFMMAADYRGIYGSGINRLEIYLNDIYHHYVDIQAEPSILNETACTAHVSGNGAMGVLVGNFCIDLAVEKACNTGIGFVVAKESHHFGMAAWYVFRALAKNYVGWVMSNSAPLMVQPGAQEAGIGANCLAFGAKGTDTHFLLDMSTSVKDCGSIEWAFLKNEYIPHGWAADECGLSTAFASLAVNAQRLFPAGGHKGYCLSAMIDMLCGVLSGANYATRVPRWWAECQRVKPNLGQVFIAIDPGFFTSNFKERLENFNCIIKSSCPVDENSSIRIPGEIEKMHMQYVEDLHAMPYPNVLLGKYKVIADMLCVKPMQLAFSSCDAQKRYL